MILGLRLPKKLLFGKIIDELAFGSIFGIELRLLKVDLKIFLLRGSLIVGIYFYTFYVSFSSLLPL